MALITKKIKGTEDVLPKQSYRWQFIENVMREEARIYGFKEIRTPVFEHTELFARGVGQTTDVVQKKCIHLQPRATRALRFAPRELREPQELFLSTHCQMKVFRLKPATLYPAIATKSRRQED